MQNISNLLKVFVIVLLSNVVWTAFAGSVSLPEFQTVVLPDSTSVNDSSKVDLPFPFSDESNYQNRGTQNSPLFMRRPSNITTQIEYDPKTGTYVLKDKVGSMDYRTPTSMDMKEYRKYDLQNSLSQYWKERAAATGSSSSPYNLSMPIGGEAFDRIFGSNSVDIRPQGSAELQFYVRSTKNDDPAKDVRLRRVTNFEFKQKIQMNVIAKIGDKIEFNTNYNTEATFDFENKLKLKYEGEEDEIIKLIEAGDVTLPLNSTLITGSQSLFGLKTQLQFGKATVTAVYSEQKSQTSSITLQGGAQTSRFTLKADEYEGNKHFFLGHTFRDDPRYGYEAALRELPIINSNVNILKIEVWMTTRGPANENNRNIVAFSDLGEASRIEFDGIIPVAGELFPRNEANTLFQYASDTTQMRNPIRAAEYLKSRGMAGGKDFEIVGLATRLDPAEYTFNPYLGFISLNMQVPTDAVLAVAYQYQVIGSEDVYQVGEFSDEGISGDRNLFVKLLKSTSANTEIPMWDLMMKNVYALGGYQINRDDFMLNILYSGNNTGVPTGYLNEGPENVNGIPLVHVMDLDRLDTKNDLVEGGDGIFDFVDGAATKGGTINSRNGRVFFPTLEPFGAHIRDVFGDDEDLANKYAFDELYRLSKTQAQQYPKKNKFLIEGMYKSSSGSEVSLNALNIPEGSVRVSAGGIQLMENQDYTVDYTLGRVRIINESILNSGTPINISLESQNMFGIIKQRLMGAHMDYRVDDDINIGATILNLNERPLTFKTNFGDEPISNTIWGMDAHFQKESRLLTKLIDKLPLIETKEVSRITADGEFAHFIPGHSKYIGEEGTAYIDDFEGAASSIDLRNVGSWFVASTPQEQTTRSMFPEAAPGTGIKYGFNRAKTAWYIIDQIFYENSSLKPPNIDDESLSDHYARIVNIKEVFPGKETANGQLNVLPIFNVGYYPEEKGPYNYDVLGDPSYSSGINEDGSLKDPDTRWGGIMRKIESPDFEAANVEYVEFWMMDPYLENKNHKGGDLYINLGEVSEDILRDGMMTFENGIPGDGNLDDVIETDWGFAPKTRDLTAAFDLQETSRPNQDVGYDGLTDANERVFLNTHYLEVIKAAYGESSDAYQKAAEDPSSDNYHYFRGSDLDSDNTYSKINNRYKNYNSPQGNSPTDAQNEESYPVLATRYPNKEDINQDNTLTTDENYYQYKVSLRREDFQVGKNNITDKRADVITLPNGVEDSIIWYQFKVPVRTPDKVIGNIQGFKSIRFLRMFFKGFEQEVICRFATLELVRGEWRRYDKVLMANGEYVIDEDNSSFDLSSVNIEENGKKDPVNYVMPPGIDRETNFGTLNLQQMNEQALVMEVCNLEDGMARAAYKTTDFDFRQYEKIKIFLHAEQTYENDDYEKGELTYFIRLGSDYTDNYYEYEVPLEFTEWNESDRELIWPEANRVEIVLAKLIQLKKDRRTAMEAEGSELTVARQYSTYDGQNKISIRGVPNIGDVKVLMMGIRNPKRMGLEDDDDGLAKCAEIWVNELRLTNFNDQSGWAATGRIRASLADLGDVTISGLHSTPGFGSIDKKINERNQETLSQFDIATNIDLGKFTNEESGWRIPMHFDYSEITANPQYNPLDPDILYEDELALLDSDAKKDFKERTQDYTRRKNLNFINVRKERVGAAKKPMPYDIENFDVSYAYSELNQRNVDIELYNKKEYSGGIGYNLIMAPKNIQPFKKSKIFKSKSLKIIKDFNFYTMPKLFSFRTDMTREYSERKLRNKSIGDLKINTNYIKDWQWRRVYDFKYDLTRGLKLNYQANANAWIHEPAGSIDRSNKEEYQVYRDSVLSDIMNMGSMNRFTQDLSVQYALPINKIPIFEWINMNASYNATFMWQASPRTIQDRLGNSIENSSNIQINTNLRMQSLYHKIPYLKQLDRGGRRRGGAAPKPPRGKSRGEAQEEAAAADTTKQGPNYFKIVADNTLKFLMMWKDGSITYSDRSGTLLPGFTPEPDLFGNNFNMNAPGLGFVFGLQDDIRYEAAQNGWITSDSLFNNPYMVKSTKDLRIRAKLEPIKNFKIELTAVRTEAFNHSSYFKANEVGDFFDANGNVNEYSTIESGSFSMSFLMIGSAFDKFDEETYSTGSVDRLKESRKEIAIRLQNENQWSNGFNDTTDFPNGYGATSQDVLIPALIAGYTNTPGSTVGLNPFPKIPLPNWNVRISSLTDIEYLRQYFKTINITHAYQSDYTIGGYRTNSKYKEVDGDSYERDQADNFYSAREISVISLKEQFNPLIGVNVTLMNQSMFRLEVKQGRDLALSFVNNQLTDISTKEYIIGFGYRFKDVKFNLKTKRGGKKALKSDLNLKLNFKLQDQKVLLRQLDVGGEDIPSRGRQQITFDTSAEYTVNQRLNIRLFYEFSSNNPFVPNQYPISESKGGITLRFTLAQ